MKEYNDSQIVLLHDAAIAAGKDYYLDPISGYPVATRTYLINRGWCCKCDCRHCPYKQKGS